MRTWKSDESLLNALRCSSLQIMKIFLSGSCSCCFIDSGFDDSMIGRTIGDFGLVHGKFSLFYGKRKYSILKSDQLMRFPGLEIEIENPFLSAGLT